MNKIFRSAPILQLPIFHNSFPDILGGSESENDTQASTGCIKSEGKQKR